MNPIAPTTSMKFGKLPVDVYADEQAMGRAAADVAARTLRDSLNERGEANIILATGNSQLAFLKALRETQIVDWSRVRVFHMDEYVGIDPDHPASFPKFLQQHFLDFVDVGAFYPMAGDPDRIESICKDYADLLRKHPADLVALGFGENGHLAFNDPPYADFDDPSWVKVVKLDDVSRRQQVGEGHFATLADVPKHAITLTIPALLAPSKVLCIVPEARKADAVLACLTEPVREDVPGTILREVEHARLFIDMESASKLLESV